MARARVASALLGGAIFVASVWYLAAHFDWGASFALLRGADLRWFLGMGGLCVAGYVVARAARWHVLVRDKGGTLPFRDTYFVTAITQGLAIATPGQAGEALKIELTRRRGNLGRWPGAGAFLAERIVDAVILCVIELAGLVVYVPVMTNSALVAGGLVGIVALGAVALAVFARASSVRLRNALVGTLPAPATLAKIALISLAGWALIGLYYQAVLRSVDIDLSLARSLWLVATVAIAQVASLMPGGIGAADVATVAILELWGHPPSTALAGALALRIFGLLIVCTALLHWGWYALGPSPPRSSSGRERERTGQASSLSEP